MEKPTNLKSTLRDYLKVPFSYKRFIVGFITVVMVTVIIMLEVAYPTRVFKASVKMLVAGTMDTESEFYSGIGPQKSIIYSHGEIITSNAIVERVVQALELHHRPIDYEKNYASKLKSLLIEKNARELRQQLNSMRPEEREQFLFRRAVASLKGNIGVGTPAFARDVFFVSVTDFDPVMAAILANSLSRSHVIFDLEKQLADFKLKYGDKHSLVIQLHKHIEKLYDTLDGRPLPALEAIGPASVKIVDQAQIPDYPDIYGPGNNVVLMLAFLSSLFFAVMITFILDSLDQTIKSTSDIETYLNIPFVGSIPLRKEKEEILIRNLPTQDSDYVRSYQNITSHLHRVMRDKKQKTILLCSTEGSTETAVIATNIGHYSATRLGQKVLIIDANLRNPSVSSLLHTANEPGLIDVIGGTHALEEAVYDIGANLMVLGSGTNSVSPVAILESPIMAEIIEKARNQYDVILVTCADLKNFTDAFAISSICDSTVLIVNQGKARKQIIAGLVDALHQKQINITGAILNDCKYVLPQIVYKFT